MNKKNKRCGKRKMKFRSKLNPKQCDQLNCENPFSETTSNHQISSATNNPPKSKPKSSVPRRPANLGRRIMSANFPNRIIKMTMMHAKCCPGTLNVKKESWVGLASTFYFGCDSCVEIFSVATDGKKCSLPVNEAAVWGIMKSGGGYTALFDVMKILDIPPLTYKCYRKHLEKIATYQENSLANVMILNGQEERALALEDPKTKYYDGVPGITVTVDGGWGKRSYGHNFSSLSGHAAIIGNKTGKLLYLGVRNKYCFACDSKYGKSSPKPHKCYKNYEGTSTAMETDIILNGFLSSKGMHQLQYDAMVGDQDSSCFVTVQGAMKQKFGLDIAKINCVNHAIKCLNTSLYKIKNLTRIYPRQSRVWLESKIRKMGSDCKAAINYNHENQANGCDWNTLRKDILNVHWHNVGKHEKCREYFCKRRGEIDNTLEDIDKKLWKDISVVFDRLADLSPTLLPNLRTNTAENFMSIVNKYLSGKRKNFYQLGEYQHRVTLAANTHGLGSESDRLSYKSVFLKSPLITWRRKSYFKGKKVAKRLHRKMRHGKADKNYGAVAQEDLVEDVYKLKAADYLEERKVSYDDQMLTEKKTVGQSSNYDWVKIRRTMLTASVFFDVIRKTNKTSSAKLVHRILYPPEPRKNTAIGNTLDPRSYGIKHENNAKRLYESLNGVKVRDTGIYVDVPNGLLGASPDGEVPQNGILEIKCPYAAQFYSDINIAVMEGKIPYLDVVGGDVKLIRNHAYYFQVIGQLSIARKDFCDFFVFLPNGTDGKNYFCERIFPCHELWETMKSDLERFFVTCMLPEIIDPRVANKRPIRDISFVVSPKLQTLRKGLGKSTATNLDIKKARSLGGKSRKRKGDISSTPKRAMKSSTSNIPKKRLKFDCL